MRARSIICSPACAWQGRFADEVKEARDDNKEPPQGYPTNPNLFAGRTKC